MARRSATADVRTHANGSSTLPISSWSSVQGTFRRVKNENWRSKNERTARVRQTTKRMDCLGGDYGRVSKRWRARAMDFECPRQRARVRARRLLTDVVTAASSGETAKNRSAGCVSVATSCIGVSACSRVGVCAWFGGGAWACERATDQRSRSDGWRVCELCVCAPSRAGRWFVWLCVVGRCRTERAAMNSPRAKVSLLI